MASNTYLKVFDEMNILSSVEKIMDEANGFLNLEHTYSKSAMRVDVKDTADKIHSANLSVIADACKEFNDNIKEAVRILYIRLGIK